MVNRDATLKSRLTYNSDGIRDEGICIFADIFDENAVADVVAVGSGSFALAK